jgi:hypothetical protein
MDSIVQKSYVLLVEIEISKIKFHYYFGMMNFVGPIGQLPKLAGELG